MIAVMIAAVTVLMIAHLAEVLVWSFTYATFRVAPEGSDIIYFAFVNYTTLGYGDVTPVERWHLLGPMTAMNGVLLFGWSTAVVFEVLRITLLADDEGEKPGWPKLARATHGRRAHQRLAISKKPRKMPGLPLGDKGLISSGRSAP